MDFLIAPSLRFKIFLRIMFVVFCLGVTVLVYITGGVQYVFAHLMYIPIIVSAVIFGTRDGIIIAIFGGLLLGPFMPVDVSNNYMQTPANWIIRIMIFVVIACSTGYAIKLIKNYYSNRIHFYSHLPDTNIPLLTKLYDKLSSLKNESKTNTSILVNVKITNYNSINDFLGHTNYIKILEEAYQRLYSMPGSNIFVYTRDMQSLSVLIVNKIDISSEIREIRNRLDQHFYVNKVPVHLETVVGSSVYQGNVTKTLQQSVVASRYSEKHHAYHTMYKEAHDESNLELIYLGTVLDGLKNDDFYLVFHPQYNTSDEKPVCLEALIRWNHKTLGPVQPSDFIPVIEKTELINPLTEWVIKKSLETIKVLEKNAIDIIIAINISTKNLFDGNFIENIKKWLEFYNVKPQQIEFEVTESSLMMNPIASEKVLQELKKIHIELSLDDFGTGYSSFTYLTKFMVHKLKIDRSFISNLESNQVNKTIVDTSVYLANKLNIVTVAEGVETREHLNIVRELGCHYGQGYFWTKPLKLDDVITYLKALKE